MCACVCVVVFSSFLLGTRTGSLKSGTSMYERACMRARVFEAIVDECVTFTTGKEKLLAINFALAGRMHRTSVCICVCIFFEHRH